MEVQDPKQVYLNALDEIKTFYGDKCAERSGVPLINHILEGCAIIYNKSRDMCDFEEGEVYYIMASFCLHPIYQSGEPFTLRHNYPKMEVLENVIDYVYIANSYLCKPETDHITNSDLLDNALDDHFDKLEDDSFVTQVMLMLYADKVQNEKDFNIYHKGTHPRSDELAKYFQKWIRYLELWLFF